MEPIPNTLWNQPEAAGLNAIAEGFRHLGFKDDHQIIDAETIVYDALYAYCKEMVRHGRPDGGPLCRRSVSEAAQGSRASGFAR